MNQCLKCKSPRLVTGKVVGTRGQAIFRPANLRFLSLTLMGGVPISEGSFGCLDCGAVWASTSPEKLRDFVQRNCKQTSDGLTA